MKAVQSVQTAPASHVFFHVPKQEINYSSYHPDAALCENVPSITLLKMSLAELRRQLEDCGVPCTDLRDVLVKDPNALRAHCEGMLTYTCREEDRQKLAPYMSDKYKRSCLAEMDADGLLSILYHRPKLHLVPTKSNTGCQTERIEITPITNSVFSRDPQIITAKGMVMNRMHTTTRNREVVTYEIAWKILDIQPIGKIPEGGRLEGGDFMTIRRDLALCGVGMRSNMEACQYLMDHDLLGTDRFGAVVDRNDQSQQRMHLDTYFNMVNVETAMLLDFSTVPGGKEKDLRRFVQLFKKDEHGKYQFERQVQFSELLAEEGIRVVWATHEEQLDYMINFIIVDDKNIISGNPRLGEKLAGAGVKMNVRAINFEGVNRMFGSVHCATQIIRP